jgi:hypothetical protein
MRGSASVRVRNFSVGSVRSQSADSEKSADLRPQADASAVRTSLISTLQNPLHMYFATGQRQNIILLKIVK